MAVEVRPASVGSARLSPEPELKHEPRTLAARKAYPRDSSPLLDAMEHEAQQLQTYEDMKRLEDAKLYVKHQDMYDDQKEINNIVPTGGCKDEPLDLSVRKVSVCDFARHPFNEAADYVRAQLILSQSQGFLATARDSGTDSDDSAGRFSPGDDAGQGKAYKKSLIKRYSKCCCCRLFSAAAGAGFPRQNVSTNNSVNTLRLALGNNFFRKYHRFFRQYISARKLDLKVILKLKLI